MKIAIDHKKLHLRFLLGIGFVVFVIRKVVAKKDDEAAKELKPLGRDIKKFLKKYKRANGHFNLVEIEDKDGTHILIRI